MRVTFISNYINHHQLPFCNAMYKKLGDDFTFIQSEPMEEERSNMGWGVRLDTIPYLKCLYDEKDKEECLRLIDESEVCIAGWTNAIKLVIKRMKKNKLTLRISERIYREGQWKFISPMGLISKYNEHVQFKNSPVYLLCAGAYVPSDFSLIKAYPKKMYRFGYFPELRRYDLNKMFAAKDSTGKIEIIFAGRFMKLKHPEYLIWLARDLLKENEKRISRGEVPLPDFRIHMVGDGEMFQPLRYMVTENKLLNNVVFYGFQPPEKVRALMERCHIHVFPSDELEGWGAVVNEAMNSACAVVGSAQAGAVPYLINHGVNGLAFPGHNYDQMKEAVRYLLTHPKERESMGREAYKTITSSWNADDVVDTLMYMLEGWMEGLDHPPLEGPLSEAPVISPRKMFQYMLDNGKKTIY